MANFTERTNCVIHLNDLADTEKLAKDVAESVLLVNATSVGMHPHAHSSPIENYAMIQPKLFVYDAIYNPRETQLLKEPVYVAQKQATAWTCYFIKELLLLNNGQDKKCLYQS